MKRKILLVLVTVVILGFLSSFGPSASKGVESASISEESTPELLGPLGPKEDLNTGMVYFSDLYEQLPSTCFEDKAVVPRYIVIHTDGQSLNIPDKWNVMGTYYGLGTSKSVHFAVSNEDILQMLPMYKEGVAYAAGTYPQYKNGVLIDYNGCSIQIEMGGQKYDRFVDGTADELTAGVIEATTKTTLKLVVRLMLFYDIPIENVLGHDQIQKGKVDPGRLYMEQYFLPRLKDLYDKYVPDRMGSNLMCK